jgi:hypothetical protein
VTPATVASVAVTPANPSIPLGTTQPFTATAAMTDGTTQNVTTAVTWSATNGDAISNVAASYGVATARQVGLSTIAATYVPPSGTPVSGSTMLTVTAATLVSIAVTPSARSLIVGSTQQFAATGTYTDGSTQDLTQSVSWLSSAAAVFAVSGAAGSVGLGTAVAVGTATVTATDPATQDSGTATVTVTAPQSASAVVGPAGGTVQIQGVGQLVIPAGALSASTTVIMDQIPTPSIPNSGVVLTTSAVSLGPEGLTFTQPVFLTLTYDPSLLPASALPTHQQIYQVTGGALLPDSTLAQNSVDTIATALSVPLTHFSLHVGGVMVPGDAMATLVSGDHQQGGYDFWSQTYKDLSGGDLYFDEGAFWANNYNERGVADLGPCSSVDSLTTVPKTTYSRFNVTAVVGDCYASPLHDNNRWYAVFQVTSLTSDSVTITWTLLPVPITQLAYQHCEPWQNHVPVAPTTTASVLSDYLTQNWWIANAMNWIQPVVTSPPTPPTTVSWTSWPPEMQTALLDNFVAYWAWYAGGMVGPDPTPVTDPPPNQHATSGGDVLTVLTPADAQALYIKYLALSFVVELQGQVPWSLLDFDAASLAELLDSQKFFTMYTSEGYALIALSVIPAPPLTAAAYVAQNHFVCTDRPKTIAEAVFWARNLQHYNNTSDGTQDELDFWQYPGNPPASRVLAGTIYSGGDSSVPTNLNQWVQGCHGTTGLLKSLLRTINIPVEEFTEDNPSVSQPNSQYYWSGHAVPHFISEGLWLSHGDDPYIGTNYASMLPFPLEAMEISDAQFFAWFPNTFSAPLNGAPFPNNGRQANELDIAYLDTGMFNPRLTDLIAQPTPPDANICAQSRWSVGPPNNFYTCAEAESAGLLTMLDPLLAPYVAAGGPPFSGLYAQDTNAIPSYRHVAPEFQPPPCDTCVPQVCAAHPECCGSNWSIHCAGLGNLICGTFCFH